MSINVLLYIKFSIAFICTTVFLAACQTTTGPSENTSSRLTVKQHTSSAPVVTAKNISTDGSVYQKPDYDALAKNIDDLKRKLAKATPGDVIALANGTYKNVKLSIKQSNLSIVAETSGQVFVEGISTVELTGDHLVFEGFTFRNGQPAKSKGAIIIKGSHNRVTNCKIDHFNDSEPEVSYKWISFDKHAKHGKVDHCTFTGKETEGALLVVWRDDESAQYHHIYRNIFSDYQYDAKDDINNDNNGWETIRIGTSKYSQSSSYTTVEYNYFYDCNGEIEIISNKSGHNTYRFNTFESSAGLLTLRHGSNCTVDSNYFLVDDKQGGGIRVIDKGHTITNNYIEGVNSKSNSRGGICLSSSQESPALNGYWEVRDVKVANNTIINSKQSLLYGSSAKVKPPLSASISNNLIYSDINANKPQLENLASSEQDTGSEFIRVLHNKEGVELNISKPSYTNNYFFGLPLLGLDSTPKGIKLEKPPMKQTANGQFYVADESLSLGAPKLEKLSFESEVGASF